MSLKFDKEEPKLLSYYWQNIPHREIFQDRLHSFFQHPNHSPAAFNQHQVIKHTHWIFFLHCGHFQISTILHFYQLQLFCWRFNYDVQFGTSSFANLFHPVARFYSCFAIFLQVLCKSFTSVVTIPLFLRLFSNYFHRNYL